MSPRVKVVPRRVSDCQRARGIARRRFQRPLCHGSPRRWQPEQDVGEQVVQVLGEGTFHQGDLRQALPGEVERVLHAGVHAPVPDRAVYLPASTRRKSSVTVDVKFLVAMMSSHFVPDS